MEADKSTCFAELYTKLHSLESAINVADKSKGINASLSSYQTIKIILNSPAVLGKIGSQHWRINHLTHC